MANKPDMTSSRRAFVRNSVATVGGLVGAALLPKFIYSASAQSVATSAPGFSTAPTLPKRRLGSLTVSSIGFGSMNVAGAYGPRLSEQEASQLVRGAVERGITFFDTAQTYGAGYCEEVIGKSLKPVRSQTVIATKFGYEVDATTRKSGGLNSQPAYLKRSVEGSLKRLQTDRIDLLYQHRIDPAVPIEEVAGAVQELIKEGKVLHFGLSEAGATTIRRAHAVQPLTAITNEYSVWTRDPEVIPVCQELGIGLVPWSPLGPGFLTGTITPSTRFDPQNDFRAKFHFERFTPEAIRANWPIVELLQRIARRNQTTPGNVALGWLLARQPWIVPIPGTTKLAHLDENTQAAQLRLRPADMTEIETGFARIGVQGLRFPKQILELSDTGAILGTSSIGGHGKSPLPTK